MAVDGLVRVFTLQERNTLAVFLEPFHKVDIDIFTAISILLAEHRIPRQRTRRLREDKQNAENLAQPDRLAS